MDIANFGANFSMVHEHLTLFAFLVFALPLISFVSTRFWIAARANKSQRRTNWFVPDNPQPDAAWRRYRVAHQPVAFATAGRNPRRAATRHSSMR